MLPNNEQENINTAQCCGSVTAEGQTPDSTSTGREEIVRRLFRNARLGILVALLVLGWRVGLVNVVKVFADEEGPYCGNVFEDWDDDAGEDDDDDPCDPPTPNDGPEGGSNPCLGMPVWRVSEPYINLWIEDMPLAYRLSSGKWQKFTVTYKQRSGRTDERFAGFGTNGWECNFITTMVVTNYNEPVWHIWRGGYRILPYPNVRDYKWAVRLAYAGVSTEDGDDVGGGSGEIVAVIESPTRSKARYGFHRQLYPDVTRQYLSRRYDRYGRFTRFYWGDYTNAQEVVIVRLKSVIDRDGRTNTLTYGNSTFPHLITAIEDPYGQSATFSYDTNGWLTSITDMAGMVSSFQYNANGVITNLHTPYGDTGFRHFSTSTNNNRAMEITETNGSQQLYTYRDKGLIDYVSIAGTYATTDFEPHKRNSFHWGRAQFAALSQEARSNYLEMPRADYFKASMKHWLLKTDSGSGGLPVVSDTLGAMAGPVLHPDVDDTRSSQVYFEHQGQDIEWSPWLIGSLKRVTKIVWNGTDYATGTSPAIDITRNDWGRPTSITYHYNGEDAAYAGTFDEDGRVLQRVVGPRGEEVRGYGFHPTITTLLTSVTNALGEVIRYTHDTSGMKVTSVSYPSGLVTTNFYYPSGDMAGFLRETIDIGFRTNRFTYTNGNLCIHTNELGLVTTNRWDDLNRLTATIFPDGTCTSNQWDKLDVVGEKDRLGFWTRYGYNQVRQRIAMTNANGAVTEYEYCGCGSPSQISRWNGGTPLITSFSYDLAGQLTNAVYPDGYQLNYTYDALDRVLTVLDNGGHAVELGYNDYNQMTAIQVGSGENQKYWAWREFDEYGRLTNNINRNGVITTNSYDVLDRLLTRRVIGALGEEMSGLEMFEYNARGLTDYTDALGKLTEFARDALSRTLYQTNANLEVLGFTYNPSDQLLTLTDGKLQQTSWNYDAEGRVTNKVDTASAEMFRYQYDPNGRLTNRWQAGGISTTFAYDAVGNLTNVDYPTSSDIVMRYDALNRLTNLVDGVGTTAFSWTDGNQLAGEDGPWVSDAVSFGYSSRLRSGLAVQQPNASAWAQSYGYDEYWRLTEVASPAGVFGTQYKSVSVGSAAMAANLVAQLELPGGSYIEDTQDDLGRLLSTVLAKADASVLNSHAYDYNDGHQRTKQTFKDGNYVDYTYDDIGQLKTAKGKESGGTSRLHEQFGYAYDAAWNLNRRTNNALVQTFNVNTLNELTTLSRDGTLTVAGAVSTTPTSVTVKDNGNSPVAATVYGDNSFARENITLLDGNNTFTAAAADSLGREDTQQVTVYLPESATCYYDARGNLTNDGRRVFFYDDENQLTTVVVSNAWLSQFSYDGLLRRRIRKEYKWSGSSWTLTNEVRYVYDGRLVVQERDANNLAMVSYTRGNDLSSSLEGAGGIGGLLARTDMPSTINPQPSTGPHAYYHADGNGNITALIGTNQLLVAKYVYDPYGNTLSACGPLAEANLYRFSSKEYHPSSALVYYLYRYYDPIFQRWLSNDPIWDWASGARGATLLVSRGLENELGEGVLTSRSDDPPGGWLESKINLFGFVANMPPNAVDPTGLDTFCQNRTLGGKKPVETFVSHTFVYTTKPDGSLDHTYSWGNEFDKNGNGLWFKDRPEDRAAANEAIKQRAGYEKAPWYRKPFMKDNFGDSVGDATLDAKIESVYQQKATDPKDPSRHKWRVWNNCKNEAADLVEDAKRQP